MTVVFIVAMALSSLAGLAVLTLLALIAAAAFAAWRHPDLPDLADPPGPGPSPVPGQASALQNEAHGRPDVHAPAPATHGPIDYRLTVWECGRIRMWDGHGHLRGGRDCIKHVDWDAELAAEVDGGQP